MVNPADDANKSWSASHVAALLLGNAALALGAWSVRLADSGPVSAGFWRLALALPFLALLARVRGEPLTGLPRRTMLALGAAGLLFAFDLASWHLGIGHTKLSNATVFGNSGSIVLMAWGLIALRRAPRIAEWAAFAAALAGTAILMGRSLEIGTATLAGDALCLLAGLFYAGYILILQDARGRLGGWSLLALTSAASALPVLAIALALGEPVWPHDWRPLLALAFGSQLLGQGLLVYSLRHFRPLVIGLALLTQPAIAALAGWLSFGETLGAMDLAGMALIAAALVLARAGEK